MEPLKVELDWASVCGIADNDEKRYIGTGFVFLFCNWIVTAKHVIIHPKTGDIRQDLWAHFYPDIKRKLVPLSAHKEVDIAILRVEGESPCIRPLFPAWDGGVSSRGLFCSGYSPSTSAKNGDPTINVSHIKTYSKYTRERQVKEDIFEFECDYIEPGNSGGPIIGEGGAVIGIIINMITNPDNPGLIIGRATSILNLVNSLAVKFPKSDFDLYGSSVWVV